MAASVARRAASTPMPPQTRTISPFSKKRKLRPLYSLLLMRQCRTSGSTSRSSAATMATLGISVRPKPLHRAPQGAFYRDDLPAQFAFRFSGAGKHFFPAHANRVDGGSGLAIQYPAGDGFVNHPGGKSKYIRQLHFRRGQSGDAGQLIENLFQRQILASQNVALA